MDILTLGQIKNGQSFVFVKDEVDERLPMRKDIHSCFSELKNSGWQRMGSFREDIPVMRIKLPEFIMKMASH